MNKNEKLFALGFIFGFLLVPLMLAFTYPGDGADGWTSGEAWTAAAANAIDTALDAVESIVADGDKGDITVATNGTSWTVDANAIALSTDTTGNYVATIADSGASEVTVSNSGSEGAAVTLAIASSLTRDSELRGFTVSASAASGSCTAGDLWLKTSATVTLYACTATDTWSTGVGI